MGRQKIEIKKLEERNNRDITFSKRRVGLFKKAYELSTLCGADVSIVVFSPGKKAFSFGYPNVETVTDRFLSENSSSDDGGLSGISSSSSSSVDVLELNREYDEIVKQLEAEKKKGEKLFKAPSRSYQESLRVAPTFQFLYSHQETKHFHSATPQIVFFQQQKNISDDGGVSGISSSSSSSIHLPELNI